MEAEVVEALRLMSASAEAHELAHKPPDETEPPFCIGTRADLVAALMFELGLGLQDIGLVAVALTDLEAEMDVADSEEWPDKISD